MSWRLKSGPTKIEYFPKTASTAFAPGVAMTSGGSGEISIAANSSTRIFGINVAPITSADADYASETKIPLIVPTPDTLFIVDIGAGTFTAEMIGLQYDLYSTTGTSIDVGNTTYKQVTIVDYIDSTHAVVKISRPYLSATA